MSALESPRGALRTLLFMVAGKRDADDFDYR